MFTSTKGREVAVDIFLNTKDFYHPIASKMIVYDMTRDQKKGIMDNIK
jgi:hypothetical protein